MPLVAFRLNYHPNYANIMNFPRLLLTYSLMGIALIGCTPSNNVPTTPPNILFCIADDASFPHMSAYGTDWVKTPNFDRVAKEGILFNRAYTPNAKCAPSRSCILTGRNSWQLEEAANHVPFFPQKFKTYVEVLGENGYHVGHTAKGWAPGNPGEIDSKKRQLIGPAYNEHSLTPPAEHISTNDYSANFKDFLSKRNGNEPFAFWYGAIEPHRRYEYGAGINKGGKKIEEIDQVPPFWPDNETVRTDMLDYAYEIEYFDQHLGKMLAMLEEAGELANTLIIVTADNGMPFPRIKGQEYEYSNHLPLAMMWKNGISNPGRVVDDFVNLIDFTPTYLELAGIDQQASGMQPITGRSLTDILFSEAEGWVNPERDHILIGKERHDIGRPNDWGYPIRGIFKDRYLYISNFETDRWPAGNPETGYLNCDGSPTKTVLLEGRTTPGQEDFWAWSFGKRPSEELYQIENDPACMKNMADHPDLQSLKAQLKAQLYSELQTQKDPRILGNGEVFDKYEYAHPETRNFYERFMKGEKMKTGWVNDSDFEKKPLD